MPDANMQKSRFYDWFVNKIFVTGHNDPQLFLRRVKKRMFYYFKNAGFKNVKEKIISGKIDFETSQNYWLNKTEMSETTISLLNKADEDTINKIKNDLFEDCNSKLLDGRLVMNYAAIVIYAEK